MNIELDSQSEITKLYYKLKKACHQSTHEEISSAILFAVQKELDSMVSN